VFHRLVSENYPYSTYPIDEKAPVLLIHKPCDEENPAQCGTEGCESVVLAHSNYHVKALLRCENFLVKNITSDVSCDVGRSFRILIKKTNYIACLKTPRRIY
jgi:hypothetical protein